MNHVNLIGKVCSAPKVVELPDGRKIAQFTMSTKEMYFDATGKTKSRSNWHRLTAWGKWKTLVFHGDHQLENTIQYAHHVF
jgi:single-strand DNA-binding protein